MDPESFVSQPIIFGNFMKMAAPSTDRMYEDLTDIAKVKSVLTDVCVIYYIFLIVYQHNHHQHNRHAI